MKSTLHHWVKTGLALGFASFIVHLAANNTPVPNTDYLAPNDYPGPTAEDVSPGTTGANTPHADDPPIASEKDIFSDDTTGSVKASDDKDGMTGDGR